MNMKDVSGIKKFFTRKNIIVAGSLLGIAVAAVVIAVPVALLTGKSASPASKTPGSGSENQTPSGGSQNQTPDGGSESVPVDAELQAFIDKYPGSVKVEQNAKTIVSKAFKDKQLGPDFVLPASITNMNSDAFAGSTLINGFVLTDPVKWNLTSASFDDTLFEENHFWEHSALSSTTAVVPVEQNDEYMSFNALYPNKLSGTKTVNEAFKEVTLPSDFRLPSFLTEIGSDTFNGVTSFPAGFVLPKRLVRIDASAFYQAKLPTPFWIPDSVSYIGSNCFYKTDLGNDFRLPSSLKELGMDSATKQAFEVFAYDQIPDNFFIPDTVTDISDISFHWATFQPGFEIPIGITMWSSYNYTIEKKGAPYGLISVNIPGGYAWQGTSYWPVPGTKVLKT